MNAAQLLDLIAQGEGAGVEFKSSFQKEAIEALTAFANTKGGSVVLGISDAKNIVGVTLQAETAQGWVNQCKQVTSPRIIPHIKLINSSWDYHPDPEHPISSISEIKVKNFADAAHLNGPFDAVLEKFELVKQGRPTFACHLLFSKNDVFLSTIEAGRFASPTIIKDSINSRDTLIEQVQRIMDFMVKHTNKAYIITGNPKREERWDYPMDALREIIINMIVHRDYRSANDSTIKYFDDRIEFFNPGVLLDDLTVEKIKTGNYKSHLRNKQIATIFRELELIEKYGSGVRRVIDTFIAYGLPEPEFEATQGGMSVTVFKTKAQTADEGVSALQKLISTQPGKRLPAMAQTLNTPPKTIERWLKQLSTQGLIEFRGAPKTGGYYPAPPQTNKTNKPTH